jgi:hypothetical protein
MRILINIIKKEKWKVVKNGKRIKRLILIYIYIYIYY